MNRIRISTRKSPLALWQAEHVAAELKKNTPELEVELIGKTTKGDRILDQALSKIGGKDLFVKEIENALLEGEAEVAVHSLKDVPTELPNGLAICAYPTREDPRDALVSLQNYTLDSLPKGAKIGTSSLRRAAQLLAYRPDLQIVPIRGNVQTRLQKLKDEGMDGTILAYAGLLRLEMQHVVSQVLPAEVSLPAIGQGILAVETRVDDQQTNVIVEKLNDESSSAAAIAERSFLRRLEGGCQVPIAGHATVDGQTITMQGLVASLDGSEIFRAQGGAALREAAELGVRLAEEVLGQGAARVLEHLKKSNGAE